MGENSQQVPDLLSKSAFAAFIGRTPQYVTKLAKEGRLVMEVSVAQQMATNRAFSLAKQKQEALDRGDHTFAAAFDDQIAAADKDCAKALKRARVRVPESIRRMADTAGGRDDMRARWAERAGKALPEPPAGTGDAGEGSGGDSSVREARAAAEARKAAAQAEQEEMKASQMRGDLIPREAVEAALRFVGAAVRAEWDVLADQVAPLVAPVISMDECHALLQDHGRNALERLGKAIARQREELAKGAGK